MSNKLAFEVKFYLGIVFIVMSIFVNCEGRSRADVWANVIENRKVHETTTPHIAAISNKTATPHPIPYLDSPPTLPSAHEEEIPSTTSNTLSLSTSNPLSMSSSVSPYLSWVRRESKLNVTEAARAHNQMVKPKGGGCEGKVKVFNLGLPRTGTLSMVLVFKHWMGDASCHQFPSNMSWDWKEVQAFSKDPNTAYASGLQSGFSRCSHVGDIPTYGMAGSLKVAYPEARFILSTRGLHSWLTSTEKLIQFWSGKTRPDYGRFHSWFYRTPDENWHRERWAEAWTRHHEDVLALFGSQVLVLPIEMPDEEKLSEVMRFLDCKPTVDMKYAVAHVGSNFHCKLSKDVVKCPPVPKLNQRVVSDLRSEMRSARFFSLNNGRKGLVHFNPSGHQIRSGFRPLQSQWPPKKDNQRDHWQAKRSRSALLAQLASSEIRSQL